jgi:SAM-dependent methyltransferase
VARLNSRLLVPTVLRPFGEHLLDIAAPQRGDVCVDVGCAGGVMPALTARIGSVCLAIDDDGDVLIETRDEMAMLGLDNVVTVRARGDALPLRDGCAQVVTSLFSLAQQRDPVAALREMLRIVDPQRGRLACALWSEPAAVPHLDALAAAGDATARGATTFGHPLAAEHLVEQAGGGGRVQVARIHDVVRFDGAAHWWAAMGVDASDEVRSQCEDVLRPYTAVDGTLRIPTEAVLLTTQR